MQKENSLDMFRGYLTSAKEELARIKPSISYTKPLAGQDGP
jgi:hypothetical protein